MKNRIFARKCIVAVIVAAVGALTGHAQSTDDFNVVSPDYYYLINDDPNPNPGITLERGRTYTFNINTDFSHPFEIIPGDTVDNNNINSGVITYHVPADAQNAFYECSVHGFGNSFTFVDPVSPPIELISISLSTNLVLLSTGANETNLFPEFSTDLAATNWYALTVTSNRFFGGTNETICGRPPGTNVFIRIRAQAN